MTKKKKYPTYNYKYVIKAHQILIIEYWYGGIKQMT